MVAPGLCIAARLGWDDESVTPGTAVDKDGQTLPSSAAWLGIGDPGEDGGGPFEGERGLVIGSREI